ncbi:hypothetical protein ABZ702_19290 [Streptomyces cyaneofuscatus]|uniref:hypothetical protein n=1 Tax=Streptomyces cyaneofuscatus TaxID=66883 RepID=UPI0033D7B4D1
MELTYDPILDHQPVPRWRLTNPLRPPAPGRALVLVPDSGASLTVLPGEEIPAARFGAYQSVYTVDLSQHRLVLDMPLLSRDASFSFRSRVDVVCRVADPAEVVGRRIRDMSGALYGHLRKLLREVSREFDISEFHTAEQALNLALRGFVGDSAVRLASLQVELLVDEDEIATSGREFRDVLRETRLDGMRRKRHLDLMREEGVEGIIAEIMEREGPRAALAWIEKGESEQREAGLQALRMVLERGDADREPFEQTELERAVIEGIINGEDRLFGGVRRGRLRGALAPGRSGEHDSAPSSSSTERGDEAALDKGRGRGRDPLLGEVVRPGPAAVPPEDEPVRSGAREERPVMPSRPVPYGTSARPPRPAAGTADRSGPEDTGRTAAASGNTPEAEQPRRVSRVRGTAKRPGGEGGGDQR